MTETKIIVRHPRPPPSGRMSMFPKRMMCCPQRCARMLGLRCRHEGIQRRSLSRSRAPARSTSRGEPINIGMGTTFRARRRADFIAQSGLVQPGTLVLGRDGLGRTDQAVTALPVRSPGRLFRCNPRWIIWMASRSRICAFPSDRPNPCRRCVLWSGG
jgi:hypothetical protein